MRRAIAVAKAKQTTQTSSSFPSFEAGMVTSKGLVPVDGLDAPILWETRRPLEVPVFFDRSVVGCIKRAGKTAFVSARVLARPGGWGGRPTHRRV